MAGSIDGGGEANGEFTAGFEGFQLEVSPQPIGTLGKTESPTQ